jgi:uncharacterized protein YbjT (DUF2867 family)
MTEFPILIIGAAGKTGRRVDERLNAMGLATRPVSRSTSPAFDWNDPSGWAVVLDGVKSAYVTYQPDLAVEGATEAIAKLCEIARQTGLEHLVLLSGRGEKEAQAAERIVAKSGLDWTVVRASWFNQNFSEGYLVDSILAGEVALPAGSVREPFVDADDIADVAVAALTDTRHRNRVYEVTGPRAITFAEAVAEIANAASLDVAYRHISNDEFVSGLKLAGMPDDITALIEELFDQVLDGRNTTTANGVEEALGRPPKDFSIYARETAAAGPWRA